MRKTVEFRLRVSATVIVLLLKVLDKGKNIYNLALTECLKRLNRIRADKEYQSLLALRRDLKKAKVDTAPIDKILRDVVVGRYFLTANDIEKFVKDHANYLSEGFNSQFAQNLGDRAYDTVMKILYGKAKQARFKGKWDNLLCSVNSKSTDTGFLFDPDKQSIVYGIGKKKVFIPIDRTYRKDDGYHEWYLDQIVENYKTHDAVDVAYIRIVRRIIKGKNVFYAQFVIDVRPWGVSEEKVRAINLEVMKDNSAVIQKAVEKGKPTNRLRLKHFVSNVIEFADNGNRTVQMIRELKITNTFVSCLDMGPRHFAAFLWSKDYCIALLQPIFAKLVDYGRDLRILQRKLDRQRRSNNPEHFKEGGTVKKGKRLSWKRSQGYVETQARIRELHRLVRETRKTALRELATVITTLSKSVKTEGNPYKSWQSSRYGKAIGNFAPSLLMNDIMSKAERAGNESQELPLNLALSQLCICDVRRKKKLSERLHSCDCGMRAQRDVFSAYLGLHCGPNPDGGGVMLHEQSLKDNATVDRQLLEASHRVYSGQAASRQGFGFALGLDRRPQSGSRKESGGAPSENFGDTLLVCKDLKALVGELGSCAFRIPRL